MLLGLGLNLNKVGFVSSPYYSVLASAFRSRVQSDGGTVESMSCLKKDLKVFNPVKPTPSVFDTDYQAILDRSTALGYTAPSASQQTLQNTLVTDLKTAGVWDKLDLFYVFATDGDGDYATLNWKTPASFQATKVNSPTFISNEGYQGDGTSAYLDTNFFPNTHSIAASQNSVSAGGYNIQAATSAYDNIIGTNNGNNILVAPTFSGNSFFRINDLGTFRPYITNPAGFYGLSRSASTTSTLLGPDGVTHISTNPSQSGLSIGPLHIQSWSAPVKSNAKVSIVFYGGDVTNELSDFKTAVDNYIAGL